MNTPNWVLEAAAEIAGLKAYKPDTEWIYEELQQEIAGIIEKHRKMAEIRHQPY